MKTIPGMGEERMYPAVLLIDDDLISREVIATILTLHGYTLHTAESGEEAVALLDRRDFEPQAVLVDVKLPGLNGVALVEALRSRSGAAVYAISGSNPPEELQAAVDGFLLKPFSPDTLQKLLDAHHRKPDEPAATDDLPVLSARILGEFRQMMNEAAVREIYAVVVGDLRGRIAALESAMARRDAAEVRRIGHTIKGGCGMAGALQAARLGARFETEGDYLCNSGNLHASL